MSDPPDSPDAVRFPWWLRDTRQNWSAAAAAFAAAAVISSGSFSTVCLILTLVALAATLIDGPHVRAQSRACSW
jgi:hypothetical protein